MSWLIACFSAIIGYLLGSISVSVILSNTVFKSDVRKHGSGNAGATNMARVYGFKGGVLVFFGDLLKALAAFGAASLLCYLFDGKAENYAAYSSIAMGACLLGHAFPIFFSFKGGKGVTVGATIVLVTDWRMFLIVIAIFIITVALTKIVSISSIIATASYPILYFLFGLVFSISEFVLAEAILSILAAAAIIILHYKNIGRLIRGEEKKFAFKKKESVD